MTTSSSTNDNRIALITGANRGIGLELVRQLASRGIEVLLGSRDPVKGEEIAEKLDSENLPVTFIHIDVTNQATIDLAVTEVANAYGRLDILINNAGVFPNEPKPSELDLDMIRYSFDVNFLGAFAITKAFLPLLRQSSSARIVNISSALGSIHFHQTNPESYFHLGYSASKAALNMFTYQLAKELEDTKIKVNTCTPGLTATAMTGYNGHSVEFGAKSAIFLATLPDDGPTGKFFNEHCVEEHW